MEKCKSAVGLVLICMALSVCGAPTKMFIVYGGGTADASPSEILAQADLFADLPIDGIAIRVEGKDENGRPVRVDYHMREGKPWTFEYFQDQIGTVREILTKPGLSGSLMDSFRVIGRRIPWTDDAAWDLFAHNFAVHAKVAKACGLKGMLIDCEDYHKIRQFFRVEGDPDYDSLVKTVRARARRLFGEAFREFPDMVLLSFWFLSLDADYAETGDPAALARKKGDLWPAFVNGLLDVLPPEATLVDGCEHGYCYESKRNEFYASAAAIRGKLVALVAPENRAKYRRQMRASHGVWPDMYWRERKARNDRWGFADRPEDRLAHWERNLHEAADAADEYMWIYVSSSRVVDWREVKHPLYGRKLMERKPLEANLPGVWSVTGAVHDPVRWAKQRIAEMKTKGTLVDLAATGEAKSCDNWGFYVWQLDNPKPGEYYAVLSEGKGGAESEELYTRLGKPGENEPVIWLGHRRNVMETGTDGVRRAMDVVRIPDTGATRLQVLLPGLSTNALPAVKFKPSKLSIHRLPFVD